MVALTDAPARFVLLPDDLPDDDLHRMIEAWKTAELGPAVFLTDGVTVAERGEDGSLRAPASAVTISENQFGRLLAAIKETKDG